MEKLHNGNRCLRRDRRERGGCSGRHEQASDFLSMQIRDRVLAVGGNNIEPSYNQVQVADHWLQGYESVNNPGKQVVYIIGATDGCPDDYPASQQSGYVTPHPCYNGIAHGLPSNWTQDDVYRINGGYSMNLPYPEIYNMTLAAQWYRLGLYSLHDYPNHPLLFYGTLTELLSYQQHGMTDCAILHPTPPALPVYIDADPVTGFYDFYWFIANDTYTSAENHLKWASDIGNFNMPTPIATP